MAIPGLKALKRENREKLLNACSSLGPDLDKDLGEAGKEI
jgi:hypothetical protein